MPAPSWENLDEFLDPADFAVSVSIQTQDGATRTVNGIFDDPYLNAQMGEGKAAMKSPRYAYDMDTLKLRLMCKEADVSGVERGDQVTMDGGLYNVLTAPQLTGDGMAVLALALA